ncbi:NAD-dependent epimerase/dehydratase family protein [Nocardia abscessus]|uniref:NAD-dependent epimerase/dehydratase family protein n=1 Tax=Nocardia abscessus TaxID=120957 RepID=UPI0002F8F7BB|nr:NAD-dependent epimerase/dehydratase family protein [Nocardia abscessus]MCC3330878.1 NAD-dependent epimerase/dehydratase family protein [Nocardia abscessus]
MKVVVTGASGNVGTALLRTLRADDCEIVGIARRTPDLAYEPYSAARWIACDIGTDDAVETLRAACAGADALVHLAWAIHPRREDPPMRRTNLIGTENVLHAVAETAVPHLVAASSCAAYAPAERWRRVSEEWRTFGVPGSAYSIAKAELETRLNRFEADHPEIRTARIRPCGIAGGEAAAELGDWILPPWLPRRLLGGRLLPVPLWREFRLQLVHSCDVASAIRRIVRRRAEGAFNLSAEPCLRADALAAIFGGFHLPVPRRVLDADAWPGWWTGLAPLHPAWLELADRTSLVDSAKARRELGWVPRHGAGEVCAELVSALSAGQTGHSPPLAPARRVRVGHPSHQSQRPPGKHRRDCG